MEKEEVKVFTRDIKHRMGRIRISRALMDSSLFEVMSKFLSNLIVVRCEYMYDMTDGFEYLAISPWFDELREGEAAPYYLPALDENGDIIEMNRIY